VGQGVFRLLAGGGVSAGGAPIDGTFRIRMLLEVGGTQQTVSDAEITYAGATYSVSHVISSRTRVLVGVQADKPGYQSGRNRATVNCG